MYSIKRSGRFKKDFKKVSTHKNFNEKTLLIIINTLQKGSVLSLRYKPHKLKGEFAGSTECHVQPDVLLIYTVDKEDGVLHLLRIGSHSDLF